MGEKPKRKRKSAILTPAIQEANKHVANQAEKEFEIHRSRMAEIRERAIGEAERVLTENLKKSAEKIVSLQSVEPEIELCGENVVYLNDPRYLKIQSDNAKFNLECFGFRGREANTQPVVNINITQNQVEKIERYAKMSEGFSGG